MFSCRQVLQGRGDQLQREVDDLENRLRALQAANDRMGAALAHAQEDGMGHKDRVRRNKAVFAELFE